MLVIGPGYVVIVCDVCAARGPEVPSRSKDDPAAAARAERESGMRPFEREGVSGFHVCFACDTRAA